MTTYIHVVDVLERLSPLEVLDICGFDEDTGGLVEALADWIEDNLEDVERELVANNLMEESDE